MALALFIGPQQRPVGIIDSYESAWRAAGHAGDPEVMVVVACFCAATKAEARLTAATQAYWKVGAFRHGRAEGFHPPEGATRLSRTLSADDRAYREITRESGTYGTADECLERLGQLRRIDGRADRLR